MAEYIPGNTSTMQTLTVGQSVSSTIGTAGDQDWFRVQLTAGVQYSIALDATDSSFDAWVRLLGANGAQLAYNDDAVGLNSRLTFTPVTTDTYYISAQGYSTSTGAYTLSLSQSTPTPTPPTVTISGAPVVNEGEQLVYTVTRSGGSNAQALDVYYTLGGTATGGGTDYTAPVGYVTIAAGSNTGTLTINTIADQFDDPGTTETVAVNLSANSAYTLGATTSATGTINDTSRPASTGDIPADTSTTQTLTVGQSVSSTIGTAGDQDWFRVQLTAGVQYSIALDATDSSFDAWVRLLGANGAQLAYNDDAVGLNSRLTFTPVTTDTYYISAQGYSTSTGAYTLSLSQSTPTPTPPTVTISGAPVVNEGEQLVYTVTRSGGSNAQALDVYYTLGGTATGGGTDYTAPVGYVTIAAGSNTGTLTINTIADQFDDPGTTETVAVNLSANSAYTLGATTSATGTINDTSLPAVGGSGNALFATPANFASQVAAATPGQVIYLASGNYGTWTGTNKAITITAASGASPQMKFNFGSGDANFTLDSITGMGGTIFAGASNITIKNSTFTSQLDIEGAVTNIVIDHNDLTWIPVDNGTANSKIFLNTSGSSPGAAVTIKNNNIENGSLDGIHVGGGSGDLILNNIFKNLVDVGVNHTDNIQFEGGSRITIRGNYIYANGPTQGITSYDGGTNGVIIENNVVDIPRDWGIEFYSDVNSIIRDNTVVYHPPSYSSFGTGTGRIDINRKSADPAGSGTQVYNNIATGVSFSNGSTGTAYNNVSGANAIYVGGASPTTHDGFLLASNSPVGRGAASDGSDVGVWANSLAPAGVAGEAINLGLTNPTDQVGSITVNISGVPSGWTINTGTWTVQTTGTWTVQTNDIAALSVTSPESYTGALVLNVAESWVNADGSSGNAIFADNVEVYARGAPIFAISGDDNLSGSSGDDLFVLAQPIGNDTIHSFDFAHDRVDLIGFSDLSSFVDVQTRLSENGNGDAVVTTAEGKSITFDGVSAASLTADNFVFNLDTVMDNANSIVIDDNALLPLAGTVNNSGTIELASIGSQTRLQVLANGLTLEGGGHVDLSDSVGNLIVGTTPDATITNVDNTISGAGQLGEGRLMLDNRGTIIASGSNALTIDTGANTVINSGTLEATGSGGLAIHSDVANSGLLWANGGSVKIDGNVSGTGSALINGVATFEMCGAFAQNIKLDAGADAMLKIDRAADFSGTVAGFDSSDLLYLEDLAFSSNTTLGYAANSNNTGGILTVSDGMHTATIALLGQYAAADFVMSADEFGGTLIRDLPLATQTDTLTQPQHA